MSYYSMIAFNKILYNFAKKMLKPLLCRINMIEVIK